MRYSVVINNFDGGLNNKVSPIYGNPDESPDLQNVEFDDLGSVSTRKGYSSVVGTAIGDFGGLHSYRYHNGSKLMAFRGNVYEVDTYNNVSTMISDSVGILDENKRVAAINNMDYMFFSDGTNKYKWNCFEITRWGVPLATASMITSIAYGSLTLEGSAFSGDYEYRIAYINSTNVESPACEPTTFTVATTCAPVNVSFDSVPGSYGVEYIAIYRNDYLLDVVTALTSTAVTYSDNHEELTVPRDTTIDDGRPPNINIFAYHKGYIFGAEENSTNLYYSEINSPEDWDAENYIRVGNNDGYTIRGMAIYKDGLVIAKEDGNGNGNIYLLYIPNADPDNWTLELLDLSYGGISPTAICTFSNFLAILNKNGLYDLSTVDMGVITSKPISFKIEKTFLKLVHLHLKNAVIINHKNKLWLSAPYLSGSQNNLMLQYDYVRGVEPTTEGSWSRFTSMNFHHMCTHQGKLYASDYDGMVYELDKYNAVMSGSYDDDGSSIDSYYKTMHLHGLSKHRDNMKVWRYIYITVETAGNWNIVIAWRGEFSEIDDGTYSLSLYYGAGSLFGTAVFGTDIFGLTVTQKTTRIPIHLVSRTIQIKVSLNGINEYFKLQNMSLHYNLRGAR